MTESSERESEKGSVVAKVGANGSDRGKGGRGVIKNERAFRAL